MLSVPENMRHLADLRETGVQIAMDDFGTGYSSLAYLMRLDVDVPKIDKLLVEATGTGASTDNVVHHMVRMANELNRQIIAEGIETGDRDGGSSGVLREQSVRFGQGYLYGRPMSVQQLTSLIQSAESPTLERNGGTASGG